jgi:hypothetical protein
LPFWERLRKMPTGSKRGPNFLELVPGAQWERPVRRLGYLGGASPEVGLEGVELRVTAERDGVARAAGSAATPPVSSSWSQTSIADSRKRR